MVSMKDIAKECNVTIATVSKALNDKEDIGIEMKQRIKETARSMGYFPNAAAKALKTNRSHMIGVLFVDGTSSGLTHDYFASMLESLKETVEKYGYDIVFVNRHIGDQKMTYLEHCMYRNVDGVVIACVDFDDPEVVELAESAIPVVTIDHDYGKNPVIMSENTEGMKLLVRHAYEQGHRKIAYIHGQDSQVSDVRRKAFLEACKELGIPVPEGYLLAGIYNDARSAAENTGKLLALPEPPTCIFYPDDIACIGGICELQQAGLKVPEDIAVTGYDGIKLSQIFSPKLTTIKQDTKSMGQAAGKKIIQMIESETKPAHQITKVEGILWKGESL